MAEKGEALVREEEGVTEDAASGLNGEPPFGDLDDLRVLITQGRERGYLTFEEIAGTLDEVEVTKEQVRHLHGYLIEHGIDVIARDGLTASPRGGRSRSWT
jgi:hypothetical protein